MGRARSTAELLAVDLRVTRGEARQTADTARALARLPRTAARLRAGELGVAQAREAAGQLAELDRLAVGAAALDAGDLPEVAAQRPHVLLIAAPEGLHGAAGATAAALDGVGPVSGDTARQICCDADLTPLALSGDRHVLAVGRANGDPTRAQRLAIIARDRRCIGCGAPALRCQIHHITHRARGGKTAIGNLVLVCRWSCHTSIHHCVWTVQRTPDGRCTARPPGHPASPSQRHTT